MIKNPHGVFENEKVLDVFMSKLSLDWTLPNYPARNLYHYKGVYKPDNFKPINFEVYIHYYPDTDTYNFFYEEKQSEELLKFFFPQFEHYFLCCTVTD